MESSPKPFKEPGQLNREHVPVMEVDFRRPWVEIGSEVNRQLATFGYQPIVTNIPHRALISSLDKLYGGGYSLDSVRISLNPFNEQYQPREMAVAKLGIQANYWGAMQRALGANNYRLSPGDHYRFSCIPVFRQGHHYWLVGSRRTNEIAMLSFSCQDDLVPQLEQGVLEAENQIVSLGELQISQEQQKAYLRYRQLHDVASDQARIAAIRSLLHQPDLVSYLENLYPGLRQAIIQAEKFQSFFYEDLVAAALDQAFPPGEIPESAQIHLGMLKQQLANYLFRLTREAYNAKLGHDQQFKTAVAGLGVMSAEIYQTALSQIQ